MYESVRCDNLLLRLRSWCSPVRSHLREPDTPAHHRGDPRCLAIASYLAEDRDRSPVGVRELCRVVAEAISPVGARAPGRALENDPDAEPFRQRRIALEIFPERALSRGASQKMERGEMRQLETRVKDQSRLDPAIGQKKISAELRQGVTITMHQRGRFSLVRRNG